jgi:hypothetical protein
MARPRTPKIPKPPRIESVPEDFLKYQDLPKEFLNNFNNNKTNSVAFVKQDGSVRTMAFRKRLASYQQIKSTNPKSEKEINILQNNNMFRVYDVNLYNKALAEYNGDSVKASSKAYRYFLLDNVLAIASGGIVYDFREKNNIMERFGPEVYNSLSPSMKNALKIDIQPAQSESGETLQENFKNMKKKINLNQFKNLVKRIIKEEKDNLKKKKTIRITESQLRNQVRKMLREGYDDEYDMDDFEKYPERYPQGETFKREAEELYLPNGALVFYDFTAGEDTSGNQEHYWEIKNVEYFPDKNDDTKYYEIDIYDPKYADILKMIDKDIMKWLDGQGWNNEGDDYWPQRPYEV